MSTLLTSLSRRERLMRTLRGEPVDRTPVCFYELNAITQFPDPSDPFNIYTGQNWEALLHLTRERSTRITMRCPRILDSCDPLAELRTAETWIDSSGSRLIRTTIRLGQRELTQLTRQDPDLETVWVIEHYLKNLDDVQTWLSLPRAHIGTQVDTAAITAEEAVLGDSGIVMLDIGDPICSAAALFEMGLYTVIAFTEPALFRALLDWFAEPAWQRTEHIAAALPGHLWRIPGPEYASPPYLPPRLFHDYVVEYDRPMVQSIQRYGGYARLHSHGNLCRILDDILSLGIDGLDPCEPPPQGDLPLAELRARVGEDVTLFGNIEISEIETLEESAFRARAEQALRDGPNRSGSHFVLMPTACPLGRTLSARTLRNYEVLLEAAGQ